MPVHLHGASCRLRNVKRNRCNMLGTMDDMSQYREYMKQALELARKGAGWVNPNPLVGAVVMRDGEVLAAGYHDRYRGPHAERMAFDYADAHGIDMCGATVIDTLEPCCHVGSQPACTDLILAHGISRVVVGSIDPNPVVAGKGLRILEEAGVKVVRDVMRSECDAINRHFFHYITTGMPYIVDSRRRVGESDAEYAVRRRGRSGDRPSQAVAVEDQHARRRGPGRVVARTGQTQNRQPHRGKRRSIRAVVHGLPKRLMCRVRGFEMPYMWQIPSSYESDFPYMWQTTKEILS